MQIFGRTDGPRERQGDYYRAPGLQVALRGRPFDSWGGGGLWFFVKKKIVQQILENK